MLKVFIFLFSVIFTLNNYLVASQSSTSSSVDNSSVDSNEYYEVSDSDDFADTIVPSPVSVKFVKPQKAVEQSSASKPRVKVRKKIIRNTALIIPPKKNKTSWSLWGRLSGKNRSPAPVPVKAHRKQKRSASLKPKKHQPTEQTVHITPHTPQLPSRPILKSNSVTHLPVIPEASSRENGTMNQAVLGSSVPNNDILVTNEQFVFVDTDTTVHSAEKPPYYAPPQAPFMHDQSSTPKKKKRKKRRVLHNNPEISLVNDGSTPIRLNSNGGGGDTMHLTPVATVAQSIPIVPEKHVQHLSTKQLTTTHSRIQSQPAVRQLPLVAEQSMIEELSSSSSSDVPYSPIDARDDPSIRCFDEEQYQAHTGYVEYRSAFDESALASIYSDNSDNYNYNDLEEYYDEELGTNRLHTGRHPQNMHTASTLQDPFAENNEDVLPDVHMIPEWSNIYAAGSLWYKFSKICKTAYFAAGAGAILVNGLRLIPSIANSENGEVITQVGFGLLLTVPVLVYIANQAHKAGIDKMNRANVFVKKNAEILDTSTLSISNKITVLAMKRKYSKPKLNVENRNRDIGKKQRTIADEKNHRKPSRKHSASSRTIADEESHRRPSRKHSASSRTIADEASHRRPSRKHSSNTRYRRTR